MFYGCATGSPEKFESCTSCLWFTTLCNGKLFSLVRCGFILKLNGETGCIEVQILYYYFKDEMENLNDNLSCINLRNLLTVP